MSVSEYASQLVRRIEGVEAMAAGNVRRAESYRQLEEELKEQKWPGCRPRSCVEVSATLLR
ncbi:hypothetical protein ACZ91_14220 [Streptomyces regensis]|nr:hypothetical protein ACZ91_14220 [Streptomyces regensis]